MENRGHEHMNRPLLVLCCFGRQKAPFDTCPRGRLRLQGVARASVPGSGIISVYACVRMFLRVLICLFNVSFVVFPFLSNLALGAQMHSFLMYVGARARWQAPEWRQGGGAASRVDRNELQDLQRYI